MFINYELIYQLYCFYKLGDLHEIDASPNTIHYCDKLMTYGYLDKFQGIYFISPKGKTVIETIDNYISSIMIVD